MNKNFVGTWREAFFTSPGPDTLRQAAVLALKGICMGSADVIPGVSGGTIALITGIYESLIRAIKSVDGTMVKQLLRYDIKGALARIHLRFMLCLFSGIAVAIVSLARLMNYLLHYHPALTWSLFFGLIAASIFVVGRQVKNWVGAAGICFVAGAVSATIIVNLIPFRTPENVWFLFLCGVIAICAMILPGISGAFILLILGKYEFLTATLKNPFLLQNVIVILAFAAGCVVGLAGFSRVLNFLLKQFHNLTLAFLTGLMAGSIQKIWPWKKVLQVRIIGGTPYVLWGHNILPETFSAQVTFAIMLAAAGFAAVFLIEWLFRRENMSA